MTRGKRLIILLALVGAAGMAGSALGEAGAPAPLNDNGPPSQSVSARLRAKADKAEQGLKGLLAEGRNPGDVPALMREAKRLADQGKLAEAEAKLDEALTDIAEIESAGASPASFPEPASDLYGPAFPIVIAGYDGDAMEPFLSRDGRLLFFNDSNGPGRNTDLHWAMRDPASPDTAPVFRYRGKLPGANSDVLDAVASLDTKGDFVFTSLRSYGRDGLSLYEGKLTASGVEDVKALKGGATSFRGPLPLKLGRAMNMDAEISADGAHLVISRARFGAGKGWPIVSDLALADRSANGRIDDDPHSAALLKAVNSRDLEYAPAMSADGLELYFTRAAPYSKKALGPETRILVSRRASIAAPFGPPERLAQFDGLVEAPTLTGDKKLLIIHKRVGDHCRLFGALRRKP